MNSFLMFKFSIIFTYTGIYTQMQKVCEILFSFHILYNSLKTNIFKELLKSNPLTMLTDFKKTRINKFKISLSLLESYLNIFLIFGF